ITEEKIRKYALLTGDDNPIHFSEKKAHQQGFAEPIAYGLLTMGLVMDVAFPFTKKEKRISTYDMQFLKPVYINETIKIEVDQKHMENVTHLKIIGEKVKGFMVLREQED